MRRPPLSFLLLALVGLRLPAAAADVLWRNPVDIESRNLFYGPGGRRDQPHGPFCFVKEDLKGTNPKFIVRDRDGVKWRIKLGAEARPETVATRLIWAAGYFANEEYFLPRLQVEGMPSRLRRGRSLVGPEGVMHNAELRRDPPGHSKRGDWAWGDNPFAGSRELNGLRVIMAVINNWDLKDENNAIRRGQGSDKDFEASDVGASFGSNGRGWTREASKGNLRSYRHSKFITALKPGYVSFGTPARASLIYLTDPPEFARRLRLRWIGRRIPREDARWTGALLARISPFEIREAFRAAGYSTPEIDAFAGIVESRIAALKAL